MKNSMKKLISCVVLATTAFSSFACKKDDDSDKAVLHVYSFTSGFGSEWLTSLIADYEEVMKDEVIDGKTGIKIKPTTLDQDVSGAQMASREDVIYFLEQQDYYSLMGKNYIADITPAITSVNPYDGKTLESKMFADQKSYFGREKDGETRYYAYPHYFTSFGIVYDIELFDEMGYYFRKGYNASGDLVDMFVADLGVSKTNGPDCQPGTSDDGLPTTYQEFFWLCDYIAQTGNNPLIWSGQHNDNYLIHFINALATDYEGYEQMRLNFTFNGEAKNLGTYKDGAFVKDAKTTEIDGTNGAELARQAGKYYAMDFYNTLYNKSYIKSQTGTLYSSTYSHTEAQEDFMKNPINDVKYAMLLDGSWWEREATSWFTATGASKQEKKLGWMPLPKQSAELVSADSKSTMYDIMYPLCVMKSDVDVNSWKYKYALDFIQFANSDAQLAKFTQLTGCTKALNYSLDSNQYGALSQFGKAFYDAYKSSDLVFPYDNNVLFANNQATFKEIDNTGTGSPLYKSKAYKTEIGLITTLEENNATVGDYFNGMYNYFNEDKKGIWKKVN